MPLPPKQLCRESPVASKSPSHGRLYQCQPVAEICRQAAGGRLGVGDGGNGRFCRQVRQVRASRHLYTEYYHPACAAGPACRALPRRAEIGRLRLNISGCINACGHHHATDIGILGVNKKGVEHFQITLGGRAGEDGAIGRIIGPSFAEDDVPEVIETIVDLYLATRRDGESFGEHLKRVGTDPFKQAVYADGEDEV